MIGNHPLQAEIRALEQELEEILRTNPMRHRLLTEHRGHPQVQDELYSNPEGEVQPHLAPTPTNQVVYQIQPKIRQPKNFNLSDDIHLFFTKISKFC